MVTSKKKDYVLRFEACFFAAFFYTLFESLLSLLVFVLFQKLINHRSSVTLRITLSIRAYPLELIGLSLDLLERACRKKILIRA